MDIRVTNLGLLEQERRHYQARINHCFRFMRSRASALRATERLRRITSLLKKAKTAVLEL